MTIENRIDAVLGSEFTESPWKGLIKFFHADEEGFYLLGCDGVNEKANPLHLEMSILAASIRHAIQHGYRINRAERVFLTPFTSLANDVEIPSELEKEVTLFIQEINCGQQLDKKLEGRIVSSAMVRFKIG